MYSYLHCNAHCALYCNSLYTIMRYSGVECNRLGVWADDLSGSKLTQVLSITLTSSSSSSMSFLWLTNYPLYHHDHNCPSHHHCHHDDDDDCHRPPPPPLHVIKEGSVSPISFHIGCINIIFLFIFFIIRVININIILFIFIFAFAFFLTSSTITTWHKFHCHHHQYLPVTVPGAAYPWKSWLWSQRTSSWKSSPCMI